MRGWRRGAGVKPGRGDARDCGGVSSIAEVQRAQLLQREGVLTTCFAAVRLGVYQLAGLRPAVALIVLAQLTALTACSGTDSGPLVQCLARDGAGNRWIARDIDPLSAQERALIDCGAQSETPDSCVAVSCERQW